MTLRTPSPASTLLIACLAIAVTAMRCGGGGTVHEPRGHQHFANPHAKPIALSPSLGELYVVNSPAGNLDVLSTATGALQRSVEVGVEPVGIAVKPDGSEVWVANHVSDSVSVVDVAPGSPSRYSVVRTIQTMDSALASTFDEPTGIAFAGNGKAYVSLSSRNQIAVVDTATYAVTKVLQLNAQEPRAMVVRNGLLFVPVFESGNQSELSTCGSNAQVDGDQCTFNFNNTNFATEPQLTGHEVDIVKDPNVPDRDLFVFDTATDTEVDVVDGVGTLLFGIAVDSTGQVYIAQTDARNAENGRAGSGGQGLADLDNRMFLDQIGIVDCSSLPCSAPSAVDLVVAPPAQPAAGEALATPHGIDISGDDNLLVVTASSSHRIATVDASSGAVLGRVDVGHLPRGVAIASDAQGVAQTAYVLNALDATVSVVDVSTPSAPTETAVWSISTDPTDDAVRRGRIAFESASASTSETFSCASCHPDGHVDQLLWVIGAQCLYGGCDQEEPRSTMPVRGLRDTLPLHWDGVLGDPFGNVNGETGVGQGVPFAPANCTDDGSCFRHLVDAALGGVMCDQAACPTDVNELGLPGGLTEQERDDMATFLASVVYPPARNRTPDDVLSASALAGFSDFYENKGGVNPPGSAGAGPETCADAGGGGCHPAPFTAGTNSFFVNGFEAPTMRGITDRYLQFSAGVTNVNELLIGGAPTTEFPWSPGDGFDEFLIWSLAFGVPGSPTGFRGFYDVGGFDIFQMIEEASTGQVGAFARQVEVSVDTAADPRTDALLAHLEAADDAGSANVRGRGLYKGAVRIISYDSGGSYTVGSETLDRAGLIAAAAAGDLRVTLTANHKGTVTSSTEQPGIFVPPVGSVFFDGRPDLPQLPADNPMTLNHVRVTANASIVVDGQPVAGTVTCVGGTFSPVCTGTQIQVTLASPPTASGMHLLQIQNEGGLISNELPILVP